MLIDNGEEGNNNTNDGSAVKVKTGPRILKPAILLSEVGASMGFEVREGAHQGGDKGSNNKKVTQVTNEIMHDHGLNGFSRTISNSRIQFLLLIFGGTLQ